MRSTADSDTYSGLHILEFGVDGPGRQHNLEDRERVGRGRRGVRCNRRRSAELADLRSVQLSVEPAREFDCTHDAGPGPFSV